jgi:hypothetical protein
VGVCGGEICESAGLIWTPTAKIQVCLVLRTSLVLDTLELTDILSQIYNQNLRKPSIDPRITTFQCFLVADKYLLRLIVCRLVSSEFPIGQAPCDNTSENFHMFLFPRNNNTLLIRYLSQVRGSLILLLELVYTEM